MSGKKRLQWLFSSTAILAASVWAWGCERSSLEQARSWRSAPIILISVDTLRADRLSVYGNPSIPTPAMAGLAEDGIVFERAFSHVPLTLPSHLSMMTGLLPHRHGVRSNAGYSVETAGRAYLPRILSENGYAVGGAVSAFPLSRSAGFGSDFDFFDDQDGFRSPRREGLYQRSGSETLDAVLPWLRRASRSDTPFFLFVHLFEPHYPYEAPAVFSAPGRSAYDAEVVAADHWVGALLEELKQLKVYDRALVMLVSDHGEGLGDHGESGHGMLLHRETLQVPWILKLPSGARSGTRVSAPAALVDVLPTTLEALGLGVPDDLDGRSQLSTIYGGAGESQRAIVAETVFPRVEMGWSELTSIWVDGLHLIEGPRPELYDWSTDPRETRNLTAERRRDAARLRQRLESMAIEFTPTEGSPAWESKAALTALGYVGSAGSELDASISPKERIHLFEQLQTARRAYLRGDWASAAELFQRVTAEDPSIADARLLAARALRLQGKLEEALAVYSGGGWDGGRAFELATEAIDTLHALDRLAEAPPLLARFVEAQPSDARIYALVARTEQQLGHLELAMEQADIAVQLAPESSNAHFARGAVLAALGRKDEAIVDLQAAVTASDETHVPAMADLAVLLHEKGTEEEARRLLELARFAQPESPAVHAAEAAIGSP